MKKTFIFAALAALLISMASCSRSALETESVTPGKVRMTFTANFEDTKTTLEGLKTSWVAGDSIAVIDGTTCNKFIAQTSGATTTFVGEVTAGATSFGAVYPYVTGCAIHNNNKQVMTIAACATTQTKCDGSELPLFALLTDTGVFTFKSMGVVLKFTIPQSYDGKLKSFELMGNDVKNDTYLTGSTNINLSTGNVSQQNGAKNTVKFEPESGVIAAGTYYLGIYCKKADTTRVFGSGITINFLTAKSESVSLTSTKAMNLEKFKMYNIGNLTPKLPGAADFDPYNYPELKWAFKPIVNIMDFSNATTPLNVTNDNNVIKFSDYVSSKYNAASVNGATITTGVKAKTPTLGAKSASWAIFDTYFTTPSADWAADDYVEYAVPVSETVKGDILWTAGISCGTADIFKSDWNIKWSKDGTNWNDVNYLYDNTRYTDTTATGNVFNLNGRDNSKSVFTARFNVPESEAISAGGKLYMRVITTGAATSGKTLRVNGGSIVFPKPANTDFSSDASVLYSRNFAECTTPTCDVINAPAGFFYASASKTTAVSSEDGCVVSGASTRFSHILFLNSAASFQTPALSALSGTSDVILSFKASPCISGNGVEITTLSVSVEGAGTASELFWTKPLAESLNAWTIGFCKIKGADATTKIKISKTDTNRCYIDDIVVAKAK